jgi:hypothetical protein
LQVANTRPTWALILAVGVQIDGNRFDWLRTEPDSSEEVKALDAILADVDRLQQGGSPAYLAHKAEQGRRDLALNTLPQEPHYRLFFSIRISFPKNTSVPQ